MRRNQSLVFHIQCIQCIDITEEQTSLINVVKALGEYLTSEDGEILGKGFSCFVSSKVIPDLIFILVSGVEFLSLVVAQVCHDKLNRQSGTTDYFQN